MTTFPDLSDAEKIAPNLARTALAYLARAEDAEAAVALVVERCQTAAEAWYAETFDSGPVLLGHVFDALAPDAGIKALAELRARATSLSQQVDTIAAHRDEVVADNAALRARLAEMEGKVGALVEAIKPLADAAKDRVSNDQSWHEADTVSVLFFISELHAALAAFRGDATGGEGA